MNALFVTRAFEPNVNFIYIYQFYSLGFQILTPLNAIIKLYTFPLTSYILSK